MSLKLFLGPLMGALFFSNAWATAFNGYIVKVKDPSFLFSKSVSNVGSITNITTTSFGTFARLETKKGLSDKGLAQFSHHPDVEYIEPNYIISLNQGKFSEALPPKDPSFKKQWALKNDGKNGSILTSGVVGFDINALGAWAITKGSKDIKIAVIDTGIDTTHPDLVDQLDVNLAEKNGRPGVDDDGNGYVDDIYGYDFANKDGDPEDGNGHGTFCAGVIGAAHNNIGVAGVMADVKIVGIKFLSDSGSGETIDAIASIDYAIKRGVNIMSNSWGSGEKEQSLEEAIRAAEAAGITFVAAAGNESSNNDSIGSYPANYKLSNIISVGSFTKNGEKSSFSNYGQAVHVCAPGSNILSTYKRGGYTSLSGTSMATPHVAGIVGLMLSKDPQLTPLEIREKLVRSSVKTEKLSTASLSGGRVDALKALTDK